jgi:antitoxin Phd
MPSPKKKTRKQAKAARSSWQLQTAKARLSEVIRLARTDGPQIVTKQGKEEVVIVAVEEFRKLKQRARQPLSLHQFFAQSPLAEANINLDREPDYGREVDL